MLRLTEIKLPLDHEPDALAAAILARLRIPARDLLSHAVFRRGYDARKKSAIALVYAIDVAVRDEVNAAVAHIEKELGPVWSLVNNAIATERQTLENVTDENMDRTIRSGVYGSLYMMQACFAGMKANGGGRIFNFGSGTGTMGLEHQDGQHRVMVEADERPRIGRHARRDPPQPEQPQDVIDPQAAGVRQDDS